MRGRGWVVLCLFVAVLGVGPPASGDGPARQRWAVCGAWRQVPVPDPGVTGELRDIAVVSPTEAWAVGMLGAGMTAEPLVLHWTGLRWERVHFPTFAGDPASVALNAVTVAAAGEVWAVGSKGGEAKISRPFAARWRDGRWRLVPLGFPKMLGALQGLAAIPGTDDLWAVGQAYRRGGGALILRWNGDRWRRFRVDGIGPDTIDAFTDVVAFARTSWAVGSTSGRGGGSRLLAARWHGHGWHTVVGPPGAADGVDGPRPDLLWAAGGAPEHRSGTLRPAVFHWNGVHWRRVYQGTAIGRLLDLVIPARGVGWAVGMQRDRPIVVRDRASGWERATSPVVPGWFGAIDGTPHNLWLTHAWLDRGGEPTLYDTYHRC